MKKKILFTILFTIIIHYTQVYADQNDCSEYKKFSINFMKCKALSAGKNFVEETKSFQNKEWTKEKGKMDKIKEKVLNK